MWRLNRVAKQGQVAIHGRLGARLPPVPTKELQEEALVRDGGQPAVFRAEPRRCLARRYPQAAGRASTPSIGAHGVGVDRFVPDAERV